ncbi:IS110 family transposase [Lachnospiraceae bacterium 46-15]
MNYSIGIDVSKGKSTIAIMDASEKLQEKVFEIQHNQRGVEQLKEHLNKYMDGEVQIVMEATSHYHFPLLFSLQESGYFVCVANALTIKKFCDEDLRRAKNDRKDALKLAMYCCEKWNRLTQFQPQESIRNDLLFLSREYTKNVQVQTRLKLQLSDLIDKTFAGLKTIVNAENRFMLLLDIYEKYWRAEKVISVPKEDFVNDIEAMAKKNGHRIGRQIGEAIYETAPQTVTLRPNNTFTQLAATNCAQLLRQSIQATTTIITEMDSLAKTLPEYQTVSSMNGVGPKTRSRLIAEIGNVTRFRNAGCLIAFCGIDTPPYDSGQFHADNRHITKRGSKYLRKVGYEIMRNLKTSHPKQDTAVYDYIVRKELEGKAKKAAKIAGLNKFLRIYYARVKEVM